MTIGVDKSPYIRPFHRPESFQTKVSGSEEALSASPMAEIAAAKPAIHDGFQTLIAAGCGRSMPSSWLIWEEGPTIVGEALSIEMQQLKTPAKTKGKDRS